jgi:type IV secretory pathway VirB3-like protein
MLALSTLDMVLMLLVMADVLLLLLLRCANNEMMNDVALREVSIVSRVRN